jgi:hypothetical protein
MLSFNLPGTDSVLKQTVETRPKAVAQWLDLLPFASPADVAQQLVMALYTLNRHPLAEDDRAMLLALYRPAVQRVGAGLEIRLVEAGVPPHTQLRLAGALLRELHIEHSLGYKQVLLGLTQRRFGRSSSRHVAEAASHLQAALRDLQVACALTHTPHPAGMWQDLHQVQAHVEEADLADTASDDTPAPSLPYRQALLIALADPLRLSHAELLQMRLYLNRFAALATLVPAPVPGHHGFAIPVAGDVPPSHLPPEQPPQRWLDTHALCRHLHDSAARLRAGESPRHIGLSSDINVDLTRRLLQRLLKLWSSGVQRVFRRFATSGSTLRMVAGVCAIHRLLEQSLPQDSASPGDSDSMSIGDVGSTQARPVTVNATHWTVSNDSAAGLALSGTPDAPLNLKVGDPLAMGSNDTGGWALGVIRWVMMRDARQVDLGVERLSPQIQPVWVQPMRGQRKVAPEPALFVPGIAALQQNDRLMLPRHLYQAGLDADVWHAPHHYALTFGRRVEQTPSFDLIEFSIFADEAP